MSLKPIDPQRSFYHTSTLCGEMFAPTDRYRLFREKILPKLFSLRDKLESLYCENNGRPAVDPVLLAGVTLLQFMEKVADRLMELKGSDGIKGVGSHFVSSTMLPTE